MLAYRGLKEVHWLERCYFGYRLNITFATVVIEKATELTGLPSSILVKSMPFA
jgi:hypothetical protein